VDAIQWGACRHAADLRSRVEERRGLSGLGTLLYVFYALTALVAAAIIAMWVVTDRKMRRRMDAGADYEIGADTLQAFRRRQEEDQITAPAPTSQSVSLPPLLDDVDVERDEPRVGGRPS
jgi:hypothetical protein